MEMEAVLFQVVVHVVIIRYWFVSQDDKWFGGKIDFHGVTVSGGGVNFDAFGGLKEHLVLGDIVKPLGYVFKYDGCMFGGMISCPVNTVIVDEGVRIKRCGVCGLTETGGSRYEKE